MKTQSSHNLNVLLERYRSGKCTDKERNVLLLWLEQLDVRDNVFLTSDEALQLMQDKMYLEVMSRSAKKRPVIVRMRRWWVAASVFLLIGFAGWWMVKSRKTVSAVVAWQRITNPGRGVKVLRMPDGTKVWLNHAAVLEVDGLYNERDRKVRLEGEAYFEVAQDAGRSFSVETGRLRTQVLGTAFNIEAYAQESEIRVSLVQGKVQVEDQKVLQQVVLQPGEMLRYQKAAGSMQRLPIAAPDINSWTGGGLVFNEVPLSEALHRVEMHFGIRIVYDHELVDNKRVTAVCGKQEKWTAILKTLLFVHDLDFYQQADTVYIKK